MQSSIYGIRYTQYFLYLLVVICGFGCSMAETKNELAIDEKPLPPEIIDPSFLKADSIWVDSVLNSLSLEEKIGQLIMIRAYSNQGLKHRQKIESTISDYKIGGLVFFQGGPYRQAQLCNDYQALANVPLLIAMDGEWGLGMRLDSTISYPYQMSLGAIQDDALIYKMANAIGSQFNRLGVHWNFAPVADINNNPKNPVINFRSFGENPEKVTLKCESYFTGLDAQNVLCSIKHFPGHGDTQVDSHEALPLISHDTSRLENIELFPFKSLIKKGVSGIMVGHLNIPALDSLSNFPTSLSKVVITDLLREKYKFKGLVVSDAMDMKGLTRYVSKEETEVNALLAGNDIIELVEDVPSAIRNIKKAIADSTLTEKLIDEKCRQVLKAKYWVGLHNYESIQITNLATALNDSSYHPLIEELHRASLTLLQNNGHLLDSINRQGSQTLSIAIGAKKKSGFQQKLNAAFDAAIESAPRFMTASQYNALKTKIDKADNIVLSLHQHLKRPGFKLGYGKYTQQLIQDIIAKNNAMVFCFRNPYVLDQIENLNKASFILVGYQDNELVQAEAFKVLADDLKINGKLPVSLNSWPVGSGLELK